MDNDWHQYSFFVKTATLTSIRTERQQLFNMVNGDVFYSLKLWPQWMKQVFWKKTLTDKDTFVLTLFLFGNGCLPMLIFEWVLCAQFWANNAEKALKLKRRTIQVQWILRSLDNKLHL